jgi:hypothetical protein
MRWKKLSIFLCTKLCNKKKSKAKLHKVPLPSPMIYDFLLTSMTFHAALAGSGMIFVTPHIICVN